MGWPICYLLNFCCVFAARSVTIFMVGTKKKIEDSLFKDAGPSVKTLNKQSRKELRNEARAAYWRQARLQAGTTANSGNKI
jgi:hypothetical protein